MTLRIGFQSHHALCQFVESNLFSIQQEKDSYPIPFIQLIPHEENLPHLSTFRVDIQCDDPLVQDALHKRFGGKEKTFSPPHKLFRALETPKIQIALAQPLKKETTAFLKVTATYHASDASGNPIQGRLDTAYAEAQLRFSSTQAEISQPVSSTTTASPPQDSSPSKDSSSPASSQPPSATFPGWIAIDFGTSNSTIAVYDPQEIRPVKGLPEEQLACFQQEALAWFKESPSGTNQKGESLGEEWKKLLQQVGSLQHQGKGFEAVLSPFDKGDEAGMNKLLREVELWLLSASDSLQRWGYQRLHQIYEKVFRTPPLRDLQLFHAELDQATRAKEISSEIGVAHIEPLRVDLGPMVRQKRMADISQGHPVEGRYYASIKRYMGRESEELTTVQGEQKSTVPARALLQATWSALLNKFSEYRESNTARHSKGLLKHAIATYPTVAPPHVRREIIDQIKSLGIEHVTIKYDEAVAAAIFHFMCATAGGNSIGIESFLARCRTVSPTQRRQNVLVFDVGGGTTDVALIQLNIHERSPQWEPDEDRGAGGRYYEVIPRLLGSSGHTQLGGDLLSLRTFYLLKAYLADQLLSSQAKEQNTTIQQRSRRLGGEPFFVQGAYQASSLIEHTLSTKSPHHQDALDAIEVLLPTRWKDEPSRAQAFYSLWHHAEEAKIKLGRKLQFGDLEEPFEIPASELKTLLLQFGLEFLEIPFSLRIERASFEQAILPDLEEAVLLAKGLLSRIPSSSNNKGNLQREPLDWLILSGKTCQLSQVEQAMRSQFSSHDQFSWNPERVTHNQQFAKLATSAGACYAEKLWQFTVSPNGAKALLRKGLHQFYFNVKNLYYFLPCSFLVIQGTTQEILFDAGTELKQIDPAKAFGAARSNWLPSTLAISIQRRDHDDGSSRNWGYFTAVSFCEKLGISELEWQEHIKFQLEVNHQLQFRLFLCRGQAHYLVEEQFIRLRDAFSPLQKEENAAENQKTLPLENSPAPSPQTEQDQTILQTTHTDKKPHLKWDIAVGVNAGGFYTEGSEKILFEKGTVFSQSFYDPKKKRTTKGLVSGSLPEFTQHTQQHQIYGRNENGTWKLLGTLDKPKTLTEYPIDFRLTLDEEGNLGLFVGEVPYMTSTDPQCLVKEEGIVYCEDITNGSHDHDELRDPFIGLH